MVRKWIDPRAPLASAAPLVTALDLDLTARRDRAHIRFLGMRATPGAEGVLCEPESDDPILYLPATTTANALRVEMQSDHSGTLEVFWSPAGEPYNFVRERSASVRVRASPLFQSYVVSFGGQLPAAPDGHRFRIDPLDRRAPFVVRRIALLGESLLPPPRDPDHTAPVKVAEEWRQALLLHPGQSTARPVPAGARALRFGYAPALGSLSTTTLRLTAEHTLRRDASRTLGEWIVPPRADPTAAASWSDLEVEIPRGGAAPERLRLEVASPSESGAVHVSNPIFVDGGRRRKPNLVLISLDTLGTDAWNAVIPGSSSFLDRFARSGVRFERAMASSSLTHVAHASMFSGSPPLDADLVWLGSGFARDRTLAEEMRNRGYLTAAFTGGVVLTQRLGFDQGFEWYQEADTLFRPHLERNDLVENLARADRWIRTAAEAPFVLFLHTYDVHGPFFDTSAPPAEQARGYHNLVHMRGRDPVAREVLGSYLRRFVPGVGEVPWSAVEKGAPDAEPARKAHHEEIRRVDRLLGEFFGALERDGLLDDTLVVVTSDHGEAFFEHGLVEHGLLYEENLHVPLVLWWPEELEPATIESLFCMDQLKDLLLKLTGGDTRVARRLDEEATAARVCTAFVPGEGWAWRVRSREGMDSKLLWRAALLQENFGRHERFDLVRDPDERAPLRVEEEQTPPALRRALRHAIDGAPGTLLRFEGLEPGPYRLELRDAGLLRDVLFAFDVEPLGPGSETGDLWTRAVHLGPGAQLVVQGNPARGLLDLVLRAIDGGAGVGPALHVRLELESLDQTPRHVPLESGGESVRVLAWRQVRPAAREVDPTGFSGEAEARLRALGYIQ